MSFHKAAQWFCALFGLICLAGTVTAQDALTIDDVFQTPQVLLAEIDAYEFDGGDLNHDGYPDYAVLDSDGSPGGIAERVLIYLSDGEGAFHSTLEFVTGYDAYGLTIDDVDLDGLNDVLVLSRYQTTTIMSLGQGAFDEPIHKAFGPASLGTSNAFSLGDVTGDGLPDVVLSMRGGSPSGSRVGVLQNLGAGHFADAAVYEADGSPGMWGNALADFDNDGDLDLAVTYPNSAGPVYDFIGVWHNDGSGTFSEFDRYEVGRDPRSLAAGDLNLDGTPDLVVANLSDGWLSMLIGEGDGSFKLAQQIGNENYALKVQFADLDQDSDLDVVCANGSSRSVSMLFNDGNAGFGTERWASNTVGSYDAAVVDHNADGLPDLAVLSIQNKKIVLSTNLGGGTFGPELRTPAGEAPYAATFADFNGDQLIDTAVANGDDDTVSLLLGDGSGLFSVVSITSVGTQPSAVEHADIDLDGDMDLIVANYHSDDLSVLYNNGSGIFSEYRYSVGDLPNDLAIGDFNADGYPDIAVASNDFFEPIYILLNATNGAYRPPAVYYAEDIPNSVSTDDLNNDGHLDLLVSNARDDNMSIFFGVGDGTFMDDVVFPVGNSPTDNAIADFDNDGDLDVAVLSGTNVTIVLNRGDGQMVYKGHFTGDPSSSYTNLTVGDVDGDGDVDVLASGFSERVWFLRNRGDAILEPSGYLSMGDNQWAVYLADLNQDQKPDLVTANSTTDDISVLLNIFTQACAVDLTDDGTLNFFDVSAFLVAYLAQDPIADFNDDGSFNFFDVSAFLAAYQVGCP